NASTAESSAHAPSSLHCALRKLFCMESGGAGVAGGAPAAGSRGSGVLATTAGAGALAAAGEAEADGFGFEAQANRARLSAQTDKIRRAALQSSTSVNGVAVIGGSAIAWCDRI